MANSPTRALHAAFDATPILEFIRKWGRQKIAVFVGKEIAQTSVHHYFSIGGDRRSEDLSIREVAPFFGKDIAIA